METFVPTLGRLICCLCLVAGTAVAADDVPKDEFPKIVNTQRDGEHPPTPEEAAAAFTLPDGFRMTVFAGDPHVAQPIAIDFDDRGRLLVAECYSYSGHGFDPAHRDRVLIFHDVDGDGQFDERKVFWDRGWVLSGLAWGSGGLWVLNAGTLSHIPDADGDDVPDGEPVVHLDGFEHDEVGHNIVNGLMWGPDGWLYGRHGIQATSYVGAPGTPDSERTPLNCGIWRYHPVLRLFEVVCRGTTNPWGMDYDEHGQFFFTNNVIGHAWHVIPGAHYKRMYGEDFNPHLYELIDQHADHYHWDTTGVWQESREGTELTSELGGGHSHCGGMIYLGDNWPAEYRGGLFMCNTHGRRVNHDVPVREGSGYILKHADDMLFANQPWFRGVSLTYGPDGGVYLTDWSDFGECHDHDGVHRTSGRIYKITYGTPKPLAEDFDLAKLSDEQLVEMLDHPNAWHARRALRLLQERRAAGKVLSKPFTELKKELFSDLPPKNRLNRLWGLVAVGLREDLASDAILARLLTDPDEHLRAWAIKLLAEPRSIDAIIGRRPVDPVIGFRLAELAREEQSAFVRMHLASAMQQLPSKPERGMLNRTEIGGFFDRQDTLRVDEPRWRLAEALAMHGEDADDHNLPLMIWYGLEPLVPTDLDRAIRLAERTPIPLLRRHIVRRIASLGDEKSQALPKLMELLARQKSSDERADVLTGIAAALRGARRIEPPAGWEGLREELVESNTASVADPAKELAVVFGDGRTMDFLKKIAVDASADPASRRDALQVLVRSGEKDLAPLLTNLVYDRAVAALAIRGLAAVGGQDTPNVLLANFRRIPAHARSDAIATLTVREPWALALLDRVANGSVPQELISASDARQMASLGSARVSERLSEVWGTVRPAPAEVRLEIERLRGELTPNVLADADLRNGRGLYDRLCSNCHKLYGEGAAIAPDLTGSNRSSLDYLLENLLDPSATVPEAYRVSIVVLADGRVLTGVVAESTDDRLTLQTANEKLTLDRADIDDVTVTDQSLMPNGQLDRLSPEEVRDLIGYLSGTRQVAHPDE